MADILQKLHRTADTDGAFPKDYAKSSAHRDISNKDISSSCNEDCNGLLEAVYQMGDEQNEAVTDSSLITAVDASLISNQAANSFIGADKSVVKLASDEDIPNNQSSEQPMDTACAVDEEPPTPVSSVVENLPVEETLLPDEAEMCCAGETDGIIHPAVESSGPMTAGGDMLLSTTVNTNTVSYDCSLCIGLKQNIVQFWYSNFYYCYTSF